MSFHRYVYYCAVIGGWAAFLAWLLLERLIEYLGTLGETAGQMRFWNVVSATVTATVVGAAIAAGLHLVAGASKAAWWRQLGCIGPALIGGSAGGAIGGLLGGMMHTYLKLPQFLGWTIMGLAIGGAPGLLEGSARKMRNGLIGGSIGGLLGGMLFGLVTQRPADAASSLAASASTRAAAFVLLGVLVGALIGLAQVVLKEAWLTVVDGFRPGRQLILSQTVTALGRGDHLLLPFLGYSGRDLETEHLKVTRRPNGSYIVEDNGSRLGTRVNGQVIDRAVVLADGDLMKLGTNIVRFNQRDQGRPVRGNAAGEVSAVSSGGLAPPPPPPSGASQPAPPAPSPPSLSGAGGTPPPLPQRPGPPSRPEPGGSPPAGPQPPQAPRIPPPPPPPV